MTKRKFYGPQQPKRVRPQVDLRPAMAEGEPLTPERPPPRLPGGPLGEDFTEAETELLIAVEQYKSKNKRRCPTFCEILRILHALGYRKVAEPEPLPVVRDTSKTGLHNEHGHRWVSHGRPNRKE